MPVYELVVPMSATVSVYIVADNEEHAVQMFNDDNNVRRETLDCIDK
jgi:hypothetical protein